MGASPARMPRSVLTPVSIMVIVSAVVMVVVVVVEQRLNLWSWVAAAVIVGLLVGRLVVRLRIQASHGHRAVVTDTPRSIRDYYLVPTELPPGPDVFVGRVDEIEQMVRLVRSVVSPGSSEVGGRLARLILLTGRPGIGKTAAALHFAYRVETEYPDGQLFGRRDVTASGGGWDAVLRAFVGALLGPRDDRPTDHDVLNAEFKRLTGKRRVLVVLDDVREDDDVAPLIPSGPNCLAVLTSRDKLADWPADLRIDLPPLEPKESVRLLGAMVGDDRVARAAGAAKMIVDRAGNVPLGVTLTGATLAGRPHWDLQLVVERLGERSAVTDEALDLAYELLTDDEQHGLVCLGLLPRPVFAPWELAACLGSGWSGDEIAAWKIVERLTESGLVERTAADGTGVSRFHILDRAYEYARTRAEHDLSRAERSAIRQRYGSAVRARHRRSAVDDLQLRIYEIKDSGDLNLALDVARSALALAQDNGDVPAIDLALATLAEINTELGNTPDITGLVHTRVYGDDAQAQARVRTLRYIALTLRRQFRISAALTTFTQALDVLADAELPRHIARTERIRTLRERAVAHAFGDAPLNGLADVKEIELLLARDPHLEAQHRAGVAWAVGAIYDYADRHPEAKAAMERGLAAAEHANQRLWQAWLLHGTARLALDSGDSRLSRTDAGKALELFSTMQHRYGTAQCRLLIGRSYARDGALSAASSALEETLETLSACDDAHLGAITTAELAGIRMRQRRPADARQLWERALRVMDGLGDRDEGTLIRQQLQDMADTVGDGSSVGVPPASTAL